MKQQLIQAYVQAQKLLTHALANNTKGIPNPQGQLRLINQALATLDPRAFGSASESATEPAKQQSRGGWNTTPPDFGQVNPNRNVIDEKKSPVVLDEHGETFDWGKKFESLQQLEVDPLFDPTHLIILADGTELPVKIEGVLSVQEEFKVEGESLPLIQVNDFEGEEIEQEGLGEEGPDSMDELLQQYREEFANADLGVLAEKYKSAQLKEIATLLGIDVNGQRNKGAIIRTIKAGLSQ